MRKATNGIDDPAMARARAMWKRKHEAGLTMQKLGEGMGYPEESARQSVAQFLKSRNPQISMLRRFAKAIGVSLSSLVRE